jgi:hypothetical protein
VSKLNFYDKLVLVFVVPLAVLLLLAVVPLALLTVYNRFDLSDPDTLRRTRELQRQKIVKLVVFALFLMYPAVSSRMLGTCARPVPPSLLVR